MILQSPEGHQSLQLKSKHDIENNMQVNQIKSIGYDQWIYAGTELKLNQIKSINSQ